MIKDNLLEIVDLQFEKKYKNIGVYGQNLTTRALEIYNEYKQSNNTVVVLSQSKAEAEELFAIYLSDKGLVSRINIYLSRNRYTKTSYL